MKNFTLKHAVQFDYFRNGGGVRLRKRPPSDVSWALVSRANAFKAADIGCEDLVEVAAALRIDGFKAEVFGKPGARGPYELRVSVPVPPQVAHELGLE